MKSLPKYQASAEDITSYTRTVEFDVNGMGVRYNEDLGRLFITIPTFEFDGPILSADAKVALLSADLTPRDVEDALEDMLEALAIKQIAHLLQRTRV